jgi:putative ABC transport system permease protein
MIGVALISAVSLLASSVRATFLDQLSSSITADFFITGGNFGLPPAFAADLAEVEELSAVSPFRATQAQVDGETKSIGAVSPSDFGDLVDVDLTSGSFDDLDANSLLLNKDPARDLGVGVGDTVTLQWQNGASSELTVAGVYDDGAVAGNWIVSTELLDTISSAPAIDFFVGARIADGVAIEDARAAVEAVAEKYPSVTVEDQAEFRASQEAQLDQLLLIINALLGLAVIVAVIGIANTIALSVFERTREFGLLRAIGMERKQLKRSVRWEAVIVAVFGALLGVVVGLPLGLGVAWALPDSAVSIIAIPWGTIVVLLVLSVVVGLVAAWLPARRAAKLDILDAIATT